ncbi:MAG TPA: Stk1 family PASTA domain-containing Ser/Thr kinase [Solirubrobacteraceae bacterium]|nr:Stk1 family PASTA domain-containing Ser/Thr kinase [Solirubrobacteraceae bacterium]
MIDTGTIVDDRYKVLSRLGTGGMADVFLAEDQQLGRKVALKLLHRRFAEDPGFVERFRREAQAAAGLQHPNVVSVYDRGEYDGTYYIAMEYLPGRTLKQLIREDAPLDPVRAIDLTIQILKAARFAHKRGVIHRDLKPHNVIVDESDHAKVTDFGIARAGASDMTETGSIMGTAQYLSPEQAQGHAVSASSDLYSIAVVLYELLTARVPFDADAAVTIALKHVSEAPTPPTQLNPKIPPELEAVVMWALNKNPADRPKDADDFVAALESAKAAIQSGNAGQRTASIAAVGGAAAEWGSAPVRATSYLPPAPERVPPWAAPGYQYTDTDGQPPDEGRGRPLWPWLLGLLLVLLLAGGGVAAYLLTRPAQVVVPKVQYFNVSTARTDLQNLGFTVSVFNQTSGYAAGTVIAQDPQYGAKADKGSNVQLTVSNGPGNGTVPSVVGLPLLTAERQIEQSKLKLGRVIQQSSLVYPSGHVISTDPSAGATPMVGTKITIIVSTGKPLVAVPNVGGDSQGAAKAALSAAGFNTVTTSTQTSNTVKPGNVIDTVPTAGTKVATTTTIDLVLATAPPTVTIPAVTGSTQLVAEATLRGAGFKFKITYQTVTSQSQGGVVLSQTPGANKSAPQNSTVTIVVGKYKPPNTTTTTTTTPPPTTTSTGTTT